MKEEKRKKTERLKKELQYIIERNSNAYREFVNYEYETDKDGNFLSRLPDKNNHTIDACAYALDSLIYRRGISA